MFSFRGRIGRWDFFKGCIALVVACVVPVLVCLAFLSPIRAGNQAALPVLIVLLVAMAAVIAWIGFALQARRLRDMGWNPAYVLPGWFGLQVLDSLVAYGAPQFSVGHGQHQTAFGALLNLGMIAAMTFWPGNGDEYVPPSSRLAVSGPAELPGAAPAARAMPMAGPGRPSFGRRGLAG